VHNVSIISAVSSCGCVFVCFLSVLYYNEKMTTINEVDESIRILMKELEAMNQTSGANDNAIYFPIQNTEVVQAPLSVKERQPQQKRRRITRKNKTSDASVQTVTANKEDREKIDIKGGWTVRSTNDSPAITWSDNDYQYTVQNPANSGKLLLKLHLLDGGIPTNSCGIYLNNDDDELIDTLNSLLTQLKNMWVDASTGTPKVNGLIQTMMPLSAWRKPTMKEDETTVIVKPKKPARRRSSAQLQNKRRKK
jgi:hypothetical protein